MGETRANQVVLLSPYLQNNQRPLLANEAREGYQHFTILQEDNDDCVDDGDLVAVRQCRWLFRRDPLV